MKFSLTAYSTLLLLSSPNSCNLAKAQDSTRPICSPDPLEYSEAISLKVEKVGSIPTQTTNAWYYNMQSMDNFDGDTIYFLDQKFGMIYSFDTSTSETKTVLDMKSSDNIPEGLTLDWSYGSSGQTYKVKSMSQGTSSDEVIVVFTSSTLPPGWTEADSKLPAPGAFGAYVCGGVTWIPDIYRPGVIPECFDTQKGLPSLTGYDTFYKYTVVNGELTKPEPFFVSESNIAPGHLGGGIVPVDDGRILWSTGDCNVFGTDGMYAPQLDHESCGKILLIDAKSKHSFKIVAKGVRNSQQMRVFTQPRAPKSPKSPKAPKAPKSTKAPKAPKSPKSPKEGRTRNLKSTKSDSHGTKYLAFMDIGGVTAEEVNAVPLHKLLDDSSHIENFGWGRNIDDGKAREGTFYVNAGNGGVLGSEPSCDENAPLGEAGFIQPWVQFGRTSVDYFFAISSLALPTAGTNKLKLLWSEFNTGKILGTDEMFVEGAPPAKSFKIKLYNAEDGELLENDLNDLVNEEELGDEVGYTSRGDPRLFHFPDGHAGVFVERTGALYKLTEMQIP
uniref:Phytase-like domain-containing protein n=1 Tax=Chaetoceros debilis TaxID=122233 RepID=A0A7S3QGA5_9STRA